jgi:hypothetical protein
MPESKRGWTPGPRTVIADPYEDGTPYFRIRAGDGHYDDETGQGFSIDSIMSAQDAHMTAAALALYEALEALLDRAEGFNVSGVYFNEENGDVLDAARAALALANP